MGNPANGDKKNIVKLAYLYFQEGRWDNAIEEYLKLLELDPEDINIHNMLGDVYVKKNSSDKAYEEYSKVVGDLINHGQFEKVAPINKKIARLDRSQLTPEAQQKQSLIQLRMKADEALEENKIEEAIKAFSEILKLDSEDLIVGAQLAELEEKIGHIPDAVQQYMRLGESFLKSHLFKKALEMFKKVVAVDPQNMAAHLSLAQIYMKQGSESDAKKEYLNIAEQALAKDDFDGAFEYANKAVELKSIEAHYIVGIVLFKREKWNEAKAEFEILLRFKLNHVGAQVYLAKVYDGMGQQDKAIETFQKAMKIDKDSVVALEGWAEYCVKKKNQPEAIKTLTILAEKALMTSDFAKAAEIARIMISVEPDSIQAKLKLAGALQGSGDTNGAADVYYNLALICENQNKNEEASDYIKKTLELNPGHAKALAISRDGTKKEVAHPAPPIEKTSENIPVKVEVPEQPKAQVVQVSPQEALKAQIGIADHYVKQGLLDEAIDIYQQLLEGDPDNPELKQKLNGVYSAYAKTGTDLTGVFAGPSKAEEEAAAAEEAKKVALEAVKKAEEAAKKNLKELEAKAREEADKQVKAELEKRVREEAEKKAREEEADKQVKAELERRAREEAEKRAGEEEAAKRVKAELEKSAREEAEKQATEAEVNKRVNAELERRAREEADKKADEEIKRLAAEKEKKAQEHSVIARSEKLPTIGGMDDMVAVAEADLLHNQGKNEEAIKLYRKILENNPKNEEVLKKLMVVEDILRSKASETAVPKPPHVLKVVESPTTPPPPASTISTEKDTNIKKKSNKIGYV
jgi:tetratricopeptide (TPR) repeat protein